MNQSTQPPKKILILGAVIIFIVIPLIWVAAKNSFVIISASDKSATITLTSTDNSTTITATGSYMGLVPAKNYTINTQTITAATSESFSAMPFHVQSIAIQLQKAVQSEAVSNIATDNVNVTTGTNLTFVDSATQYLEQVDSHNTLQRIGAPYTFSRVAWKDQTSGIAIATDPSNTVGVFAIHGTTITALPLPEAVSDSNSLSVAYAGNNTYYFTENNKLYSYTDSSPTFTRVSFIPSGYVLSSASGARVLLYKATSNVGSNYAVTLLNTKNGSTNATTAPLIENPNYTFSSSWSPDGTKVIISASGSSTVYNQSLQKITMIAGNASNSPAWLNNSSVVYAAQNRLWQYSFSTTVSNAIAYLPKYATADTIYTDHSGQYLYFTIITNGEISLYRAALHNQTINISAQKLGESNTQQTSNGCAMNYLNFTSLSMIADSPSDNASCVAGIQDYLSIITVPQTTPVQIFNP